MSMQMDRIFMFMKTFSPHGGGGGGGGVCSCPGLYTKPNFMWSIVRKGNESLYKWSRLLDQEGRLGYK